MVEEAAAAASAPAHRRLRQTGVDRIFINGPEGTGVAVRTSAIVSHRELLDADSIHARPCEVVERRAAHPAKAEDKHVGLLGIHYLYQSYLRPRDRSPSGRSLRRPPESDYCLSANSTSRAAATRRPEVLGSSRSPKRQSITSARQ